MPTDNLYAPPVAMVDDIHTPGASQPVKLWPPRGRIGRVRLLGYSMALYLVFIVVLGVLSAVLRAMNADNAMVGMWAVLYIAYIIGAATLFIQRSHDMDLSGWSALLALIPFVALYWMFKGGTPGVNRFGAPPPPNSTGVKVLAWCLLVVPFLLGIVASIAIPAYQNYTVRARAGATQQP